MPRFVEVLIQDARTQAPFKDLPEIVGKFDDVPRNGPGGVTVMEARRGSLLFDMKNPANPVLVSDNPPGDQGVIDTLNYIADLLPGN